jgi:hypothetical protein
MNPFRWTHEHQLAWGVIIALGAIIGLLIGWMWSPFSRAQGDALGSFFVAWLQYPKAYWPWASFGSVIAALSFYMFRLLNPSDSHS